MPSHIYMRVGRYADAARANQLAVAADEDYITQCRAQGIYPVNPELAKIPLSLNPPPAILGVAEAALAGQLAAKRGELDQAILHLDRAVRLQDALRYTEPEDWHYPMRESLGAVLLQAGRAVEAEAVYWENLKKYPENGWSLFGLMQALRAQGKTEDAAQVEERFRKSWARADFLLGN